MTEKIYQSDAYCRECTAQVTGCECRGEKFFIRLDRTIFCPEGGGQPADLGTINGIPLLALVSDNGDVIHVLDRDPGPGQVGLQLDFSRRYDHMQQHTAQHLLSQVALNLFSAQTLSFAIGTDHSSIEIGRPALSDAEIVALEAQCAAAIFAARPVRVFFSEDIAALRLRKPPKRPGRIRVVEIEGLDQSACGGTHLKNSAEIGLLKIIRCERVRANVRIYYAAGYRAWRDYQLKHEAVRRLQRLVTLPLAEIPDQVEAWIAEKEELRRALKKAQRRELEGEIVAAAAGADDLVIREFSGLDSAEMRFFALGLMKQGRHVLAYAKDPQPYVIIGRGRGKGDLRAISAPLFALLGGRGGGGESLLEGRASDFSRLDEAVGLLRSALA